MGKRKRSSGAHTNALISASADVVGAGIGGLVGTFGGPAGAFAGGVLGVAITRVVKEFAARMLSHRETMRVVSAIEVAKAEIQRKLSSGELPRDDGFSELRNDGRSNAEELLEGVLLKCKNEYEEKKTKHYATFSLMRLSILDFPRKAQTTFLI